MIKIYHNTKLFDIPAENTRLVITTFSYGTDEEKITLARKMFAEGSYEKVGEIFTSDLDTAYALTQNLHGPWVENLGVITAKKVRSSSIGDLFERDGQKYLVNDFGFLNIGE